MQNDKAKKYNPLVYCVLSIISAHASGIKW